MELIKSQQFSILLDINIIIDYLQQREQFFENSKKVLELCQIENINGYISEHTIPTVWYLLRKSAPDSLRRDLLNALLSFLDVSSAKKEGIISALSRNDFSDFEDCLQDECASSIQADYIITRNKEDFKNAKTKTLSPEEFIKQFT